MSVVLDGLLNDSYEPSEAELVEYGKWLGMKFPEDNPFLWIAREGLKAPLPEGWKACRSEKGDLYYFNFKTGESIWDHPLDEQFKALLQKEKENPSPKSLANGAKRSLSLPDPEKVMQVKDQPAVSSEGKSKFGALKSLKMKRKLLEGSHVELTESCVSGSESRERSLEPVKLKKVVGPQDFFPPKQILEPLSVERNKDSLNLGKTAYELNLDNELKSFQTEKLREHQCAKEDYELKLKDSWSRYQKRQKEEYDKKVSELNDDYENKLVIEKLRLKENHTNNIQKISDEIATGYEVETRRIHRILTEKYEKEKLDIEHQYQSKLESFKKNKSEELEKMCASESKILEALKQNTKELSEDALAFVETYKKAHDAFADVLINTNTVHLELGKMTLDHLIDCAKESYDIEINKIKDCFRSEIEQLKRKFATDMVTLRKENMSLIQEKERCEVEPRVPSTKEPILKEKEAAASTVTRATQWEERDYQKIDQRLEQIETPVYVVSGIKEQNIYGTDSLASVRSEREMLKSVVASMKETQRRELEDAKRDLKQRAEEELKAALDKVMREQRHPAGTFPEEKGEAHSLQGLEQVSVHPRIEEKESEREKSANALSDTFQREDLTTVLTEALRAVFAGSSFILPFTSSSSFPPAAAFASGTASEATEKPFCNTEQVLAPFPTAVKSMGLEKHVEAFPVSFWDQKQLLEGERQRVAEGKKFVENQRLSLEERRHQLKVARHQWKQDVMAAKLEGVRASSKRGQLLNKLRIALEDQARGLEYDEAILRDSERWLLMKEQSVCQMQHHVRELEDGKGRDMSTNSIDTVALMTGFFKPTTPAPHFNMPNSDIMQGIAHKEKLNVMYTKTLDRIARRLEEVTSLMNNQQRKRHISLFHNHWPRYRLGQKTKKGSDFIFAES